MKYLKVFSAVALIVFSLNCEAQKRFKVTSRLGYTAITNQYNLKYYMDNPNHSVNQFVLSVLLKKKLSNKYSFRPGLSVSRFSSKYESYPTYPDGTVIDETSEELRKCYLLDLFFEHSFKNKFINNIYYGPSVGIGVYSYQEKFMNRYLYQTNELCVNFNAGVEINLIKNTNAYIELGYFEKGLLTIGVSHNFFNKTEDVIRTIH